MDFKKSAGVFELVVVDSMVVVVVVVEWSKSERRIQE
tara:strand:- start:2086 stop:2196 length:111 start_codon:yes stop_codon:yes gene_type:complete